MDSSNTSIRIYMTLIEQRIKQILQERLLPYEITPQQARIVGFVGTRQEQGTISYQKDIEEAFELSGPSITSLLQGLERRSFITRRVDPADERRKQVVVLPKGLDLLHDFESVFRQIDERLVRDLSPAQQATLRQILEHIASNLA